MDDVTESIVTASNSGLIALYKARRLTHVDKQGSSGLCFCAMLACSKTEEAEILPLVSIFMAILGLLTSKY